MADGILVVLLIMAISDVEVSVFILEQVITTIGSCQKLET